MEIATEMGLRISFLKENPKRKHSKSRLRYASYCQARTVQEARERGAVRRLEEALGAERVGQPR